MSREFDFDDHDNLQSFDPSDLGQLVEMAAETQELDRDLDYSDYSFELSEAAIEFEHEAAIALADFDHDGKALDERSWALDVYLTLAGHGAGIWDGRWDHIYSDSEIKELKKFLKTRLRSLVDDTGGGTFEQALMDEAYDINEAEERRRDARERR